MLRMRNTDTYVTLGAGQASACHHLSLKRFFALQLLLSVLRAISDVGLVGSVIHLPMARHHAGHSCWMVRMVVLSLRRLFEVLHACRSKLSRVDLLVA